MREASIKLYKGITNVSLTANNLDTNKAVLRAMLSALGILALSYALIIAFTVLNIVERKNLEKEMQALTTEVGELELEYLALTESIDQELSQAMGFKEVQASFATRRSLGRQIVMSNEI